MNDEQFKNGRESAPVDNSKTDALKAIDTMRALIASDAISLKSFAFNAGDCGGFKPIDIRGPLPPNWSVVTMTFQIWD